MVDKRVRDQSSSLHEHTIVDEIGRRNVLGAQALLLAGAGTGGVASGSGNGAVETTVSISGERVSDEPVPETLFGRFAEHYGSHEAYPGLYAEHVTNTSFVDWVQFQGNVSHMYGFDEVGTYDSVPSPWEPHGESAAGVSFERPESGGVRGYSEWELDENDFPVRADESGNAHQRVRLDAAKGGVAQRVALPDWRTRCYELAVSVRGDGIDVLEIRLAAPDGEVLASGTVTDLAGEWERHEGVELTLSERSGIVLQGGANDDVASWYGE